MSSLLAASHVHSEWSYDAEWPLPRLAEGFAERDYRVLLMTEHDQEFSAEKQGEHRAACAEASNDGILLVPGIEYSDPDNVVHVLVWGDVPFLGEGLPTSELLAGVKATGGLAVLAHPWRKRAWERVDDSWFDALVAIEIWNRKYDGWRTGSEAAGLLDRSGLPAFVGHDFHRKNQFFPFGMRLDLEGPVEEATVLAAVRSGAFEAQAFGMPAQRYRSGPLRSASVVAEGVRRAARSLRDAARRPD